MNDLTLANDSEVLKNESKKISDVKIPLDPEDPEKTRESCENMHPEWFRGVKACKTKEDYFNTKLRGRIKSYIRQITKLLEKKWKNTKNASVYAVEIDRAMSGLETIAEEEEPKRRYFDRKCNLPSLRFCDEIGKFECINHRFDSLGQEHQFPS